MKVRVVKCSGTHWYKDRIGEVFDVYISTNNIPLMEIFGSSVYKSHKGFTENGRRIEDNHLFIAIEDAIPLREDSLNRLLK